MKNIITKKAQANISFDEGENAPVVNSGQNISPIMNKPEAKEKVYVVEGKVDYEPGHILGIYKSKQKADDFVNNYYKDQNNRLSYDNIEVDQYDLIL